jgi:hypothetical protein
METHSLVDAATGPQIAIQNESKLRYAVPSEIWQFGTEIEDLVRAIAPSLVSEGPTS